MQLLLRMKGRTWQILRRAGVLYFWAIIAAGVVSLVTPTSLLVVISAFAYPPARLFGEPWFEQGIGVGATGCAGMILQVVFWYVVLLLPATIWELLMNRRHRDNSSA